MANIQDFWSGKALTERELYEKTFRGLEVMCTDTLPINRVRILTTWKFEMYLDWSPKMKHRDKFMPPEILGLNRNMLGPH